MYKYILRYLKNTYVIICKTLDKICKNPLYNEKFLFREFMERHQSFFYFFIRSVNVSTSSYVHIYSLKKQVNPEWFQSQADHIVILFHGELV